MAFLPEIQPIHESDAELRALLDDGEVDLPSVLPALAYALNDLSILPAELSPDPTMILEEQAGWTAEQQDRVRDLAAAALGRLRDDGPAATATVSDATTEKIMEWTCGVPLSGSYLTMLREELSLNDDDLRAPDWHKADIAPDRDFGVVVIGAGMSGILAAHRLQQAGVDVVLLEKNNDLGGTWFENTYPGCRVDVSNHVYCYSFMQKHDWPQYHSSQGVLLEYFKDCADHFGVRDSIRFGVEVISVTWDESANAWHLQTTELVDGAPVERTLTANVVVSAVGQLNRPKLPDIEGIDDWTGPSWHSAQWNHDFDLTGKRVGIIGTGCSALQLIPHVAEQAASTTIFQRTPNWLMPRPQYQHELANSLVWLFTHVPNFNNWFRLRLFWRSHEGLLPMCTVDPDWEDPGDGSVSAMSQFLGTMLREYLNEQFGDRPDLLEAVTPNYPMGAKRFVVDDGTWATTLKRDDVDLRTDRIERITSRGVQTEDADHEFDVLIFSTGFAASEFLTPMAVTGRDGADLHEQWGGDARAYLGVTSPKFPNFFYLYGPNTNIVINGSIIYFSECEVGYIVEAVRHLLENDIAAIDVRTDVHDAYNERIDLGNQGMAWGVSDVSSWYKSASGRVAQNWPFSMLEFWEQTQNVDQSDYEVLS